jgi:Ca-activated chloride channel homolog
MIKAFLKYTFLIILVLSFGIKVSAQKERKHIRKGNKDYELAINDTGAVDTIVMQKAELLYRKALDEKIDSYKAGFNLGNSLFKQQKFDEAAEQYELLVDKAESKEELAETFYNLGNSQLAGGKLKESIESYKQSLRKNPQDTATKYNLAVAQKMLNEADQQQQQQQDQNQENQDQQDQEEQEKQEQQEEQQEGDQNQEQQQQEQEEKEGEEEQQQAKEGEENDEEEEQKQMQKKDEISKEDAERMLKALEQDEKKILQKLQDEKSKKRPKKLEKDW